MDKDTLQQIRWLIDGGKTDKEIGKLHGYSTLNIHNIRIGRTYRKTFEDFIKRNEDLPNDLKLKFGIPIGIEPPVGRFVEERRTMSRRVGSKSGGTSSLLRITSSTGSRAWAATAN